jgi:hypothetical protein
MRRLRTIVLGGLAFAAAFSAAGAILWTIGFARRSAAGYSSAGWPGNAAMAAWLIGAQALVNAAAFTALTAASRKWRDLAPRLVIPVGGLAGLAAFGMLWTGVVMALLRPLGNLVGAVPAVQIAFVLPGLAAGAAALAWVALKNRD